MRVSYGPDASSRACRVNAPELGALVSEQEQARMVRRDRSFAKWLGLAFVVGMAYTFVNDWRSFHKRSA